MTVYPSIIYIITMDDVVAWGGGPDDCKVIQGRWNNNNVNKAVLLITG